MNTDIPRDLALKALNRLSLNPAYSSRVLDRLFQDTPDLDERDRAFVSQLVQGVLRWRLRLDWIIGRNARFPLRKIDPLVLNILHLALYQIFFLDRVPESAAVNEAVKQAKASFPGHIVSFVNGLLRNVCRHKEKAAYPDAIKDPVRFLSVYHSHPVWLVEKWIAELGAKATEALLEANNQAPSLVLRVNTLAAARPELMERLTEEGLDVKPTPYSPVGVIVEGLRGRVDQLRAFKQGLFQVQDEGAQIASFLLSPLAGDMVLDLCAGLGGKTGQIAEIMGNRGKIVALDTNRARLISLAKNARRLGIRIIHSTVADATAELPVFPESFDRILVDAPCSGLGVLSRHPDGKWNRDSEGINRLALLQAAVLAQAVRGLKKGGSMLYVTCTISREENEGVVEGFLKSHPAMVLDNLADHAPSWAAGLIDENGFLRTYPHLHSMDGFFAALFTKPSRSRVS
jgi:16S rRNA (cytosine967-C5)-methyltransferase